MPKKTLPKTLLTLLFLSMIGLAFFILWSRELPLKGMLEDGTGKKAISDIRSVYSLEPFVVELAGRYIKVTKNEDGKRPVLGTGKKYLIMAVDLELQDKETETEVNHQLKQVRDMINDIVSLKNIKEIETTEGKVALGDEIVSGLNGILHKGGVTQAFFREFIIQ